MDSADGAAVRIAMTVASQAIARTRAEMGSDPNFAQQNLGSDPVFAGSSVGRLLTVTSEQPGQDGEVVVSLAERRGLIHADLSVAANVTSAVALQAMCGIWSPGVKLHGAGFIVTPEEAALLGYPVIVKDYRNGRDLTDRPRGVGVIDAFGPTADELRTHTTQRFTSGCWSESNPSAMPKAAAKTAQVTPSCGGYTANPELKCASNSQACLAMLPPSKPPNTASSSFCRPVSCPTTS